MSQLNQPATQPQGSNTKIVIIAIAMGILAAIVIQFYIVMNNRQNKAETITVYTLRTVYDRREQFDIKDVRPIKIPQTLEEQMKMLGAIRDEEQLSNYNNKAFARTTRENELLIASMFLDYTGDNLEAWIDPGNRLLSIDVRSDNAPGPLRPDGAVDLYGTFLVDGVPRTVAVIKNVRVVALGAYYNPAESDGESRGPIRGYRSITIELPEKDVEPFLNVMRAAEITASGPTSSGGYLHLTVRKLNEKEKRVYNDHGGLIEQRVVRAVEEMLRMEEGSLYGASGGGG